MTKAEIIAQTLRAMSLSLLEDEPPFRRLTLLLQNRLCADRIVTCQRVGAFAEVESGIGC
jgi:hypothetical protein